MTELRGYDAWLEAPYQRQQRDAPTDIEDMLGLEVWIEEDDAWCEVIGFEEWEDADEDGRYGGVDLIVKPPNGREYNVRPDAIEGLPTRTKQ